MTVRVLAAIAVAVLLTGCGGDPGTAPDRGAPAAPVVLREATLRPGEAVPAPAGTPLISLSGQVGPANQGNTVALDRRTLARLSQVQLTTYEPWVKKDMSFRGVWLADVLALAGAANPAGVQVTALDDYTVDFSAADLRSGGILLATSDGTGADIPIEDGGPTRIVFQRGLRAGANADQWIWSLRSIEVR